MASLSHHLKYGWDPLHISIFLFRFACDTFIAFITLTPIYSASFVKVFMLGKTSLTNLFSLVNPNVDKYEGSVEAIVKCGLIHEVFL